MICNVVGARPNFVKMAPVILEMKRRGMPQKLVHTGQHYDKQMSKVFFDELGMPEPDVFLGVGSASHAEQTARILEAFEAFCLKEKPSLVVVGGDVNSTLACSLAAAKLGIDVAHVESGLRSFDRTMPEEINRVLTDHLAAMLFTTEASGTENLLKEGIAKEKISFVGNSMIDTLCKHVDRAVASCPWKNFGFQEKAYALVSLHRPSNVDHQETLSEICKGLKKIAGETPMLFPVHPRTKKHMAEFHIDPGPVRLVEPLGYLDFLGLMARARFVITDSGGIQEETTALKVPCLTLRLNTERPVTLEQGTNRLVPLNEGAMVTAVRDILASKNDRSTVPLLWDGRAACRIVDIIQKNPAYGATREI